ncbi:MAG: hypothetical protein JJT96_19865 [Opitutales bacterium]|nr:hypothetical protein [Opitutales bacterium]
MRQRIDAELGRHFDWVPSDRGLVDWVKACRSGDTFLSRLGVAIPLAEERSHIEDDVVQFRDQIHSGHKRGASLPS